jgi:hypothetical protein
MRFAFRGIGQVIVTTMPVKRKRGTQPAAESVLPLVACAEGALKPVTLLHYDGPMFGVLNKRYKRFLADVQVGGAGWNTVP